MKKGYFLMIDPQKNTALIDANYTDIGIEIAKSNVVKHSTRKELIDYIKWYLNGGYQEEEERKTNGQNL